MKYIKKPDIVEAIRVSELSSLVRQSELNQNPNWSDNEVWRDLYNRGWFVYSDKRGLILIKPDSMQESLQGNDYCVLDYANNFTIMNSTDFNQTYGLEG